MDLVSLCAELSYRFREVNRLFASVSPFSLTPISSILYFAVRILNIPTTTSQIVGFQDAPGSDSKDPCSCLVSLGGDNPNLIASAGWSKKFYLWDVRQSDPISTIDLPGKAFDMDYDMAHNRIVIATSGRKTCFIDMKDTGKAEMVLERESSLKFQTRCVKFFPDGLGIALGSVEGRVGVEFLDELGVKSSMKKYAFKCHRVNDTVYPVNCIEFHPRFTGTFATGGCDGGVGEFKRLRYSLLIVPPEAHPDSSRFSFSHESSGFLLTLLTVLWDGNHKKKLTALPSFPTSISALAFNYDGSELAIASSYTFEEGDREHPKDEIFVRKILDSECLPKPK